MIIGIDISQTAYFGGGVASYTYNLVKALLEIAPENRYVLFGASLRRLNLLRENLASLSKSNQLQLRLLPIPLLLMDLLWNRLHIIPIDTILGKVDVFHTSDWLEPPSRVPKITTIHDMLIYKYPQYIDSNIISTQKRKLKWVASESKVIIADSQST